MGRTANTGELFDSVWEVSTSQPAHGRALQDRIQGVTGMRSYRVYVAIALASSSVIMVLSPSSAQQRPGDPRRGHEIAARVCTNCHVIDRKTSGPMRVDVPSFPVIANRPGATAEGLVGKIIVPHPAMPGVPLTVSEIRDIVAYIVSLKRD
jgi:mono/diheme cytochrome c family protein